MASRQNREARDEVPSFGTPLSTPAPRPQREREREEKLETKLTVEEREKLIEEHEKRGREETAKRSRDRETEAPKPTPKYTTIGESEGRPTVDIIEEREQDVEEAIRRAEGAPSLEAEPVPEPEIPPARPIRKPPKQKR